MWNNVVMEVAMGFYLITLQVLMEVAGLLQKFLGQSV